MYLKVDKFEQFYKLPKAWPLIIRYGKLNFNPANDVIKVLDVGCRVGTTLLKLHQMDYTPTGIDIVPEYVEAAKKYSGCPVYTMGASNMSFEDESFDMIICTETLEHVLSQLETLQEFHRVLKPNGKIFLSVPNPYHLPRVVYPKHFVTGELLSGHLSVVDLTQYLTLFHLTQFQVVNWTGFPNKWIFPRWKRFGILLDKLIGKRMNRFKQNLFFELLRNDCKECGSGKTGSKLIKARWTNVSGTIRCAECMRVLQETR